MCSKVYSQQLLSLAVPVSTDHQCKGQDTKSGRVSGLGVAKWSFVRQVSIAIATEWEIEEQSLYGIEGWSLFRGCFTTGFYVAAIRTRVSDRYKAACCSSGWSGR